MKQKPVRLPWRRSTPRTDSVQAPVPAEPWIHAQQVPLQRALTAGKISTIEWDIEHNHIAWSDNLEGLLHLPPGGFGGTFEAFMALVHVEDRAKVQETLDQALHGNGDYYCAFRMLRGDGSVRWTETRATIERDQHGLPLRMLGVDVDITDRKEAEERLRFALDTGRTGTWDLDLIERTVQRSREYDRVFGYDEAPPAWTYEIFLEHVLPEDRAQVNEKFVQAVATRTEWSCECRIRRADGVVRWIRIAARRELRADGLAPRMAGTVQDVTEQKLAQESLRAAHDTFRHLVEQSPFGVYAVDADFRLVQVSAGAQKVFATVQPLLGRDFAEILHLIWPEPFASEAVALFRRTLETGEPYRAPSTVERRHDIGQVESYDWKIERVMLPDGRFGVVCHFYDLSERLNYESVLREREHFLQRVIDVTPGVVCVFDLEKQCSVFINRMVASLLGYSPEEIGAMGSDVVPSLMHPDDLPRFAEHLTRVRTLADHEIADFEHRMRARSGAWRWFHNRDAVFARDAEGVVRQLIGTAIDVTARKQNEAALRETETQLRLIADALPICIVRCDTQLRYEYVNTAYAARFGLRPEELIGKRMPEVIGESAYQVAKVYIDRLLSGEGVQYEATIPYASLGPKFMRSTSVPDFDDAGRVRGFMGVLIDLTDRKRAEDALKDADRHKDEFLAMLAHELRNPLAPIRNAARILRAAGPAEPRLEKARDIIDRQVAHLARLVDDLLDISRVTQGKIVLVKAPVHLPEAVSAGVDLARPLLDAKQHKFTLTLPRPCDLSVEGDATRIAQVVGNILNNAAKYTDPGGEIELTLAREVNSARITVQDSGVGIAADMLPHVFELFAQAERSRDRSQGGLGIGLSLVKNLVELHGGRVAAHSAGAGCGSTFSVYLPLANAPVAENGDVPRSPASAAKRVLVVDDDLDAAESMGMLLEVEGHTVWYAHNGRGAVEAAVELRPDVVLLDIGLPGIDGYEVARRLRSETATRDSVLIAITGYGQDEDRALAEAAGFDHHLVKPVSMESLHALFAA
jgi:PAS domain S-box-containing protein